MTETPEIKQQHISPAAARRREAKRRARDCFFDRGNTLTLIAAVILPLILYVALQGIYSMVYMSWSTEAAETDWFYTVDTVVNVLLAILPLPLVGGTVYIATGLARGERRELKDIFYAYTSWRAYFRTWVSLLVPLGALAAVAGIVSLILSVSFGLSEMATVIEGGEHYAMLIYDCGDLLAVLAGLAGLLLCGFVQPFLWLTYTMRNLPLTAALRRSVSLVRGHLGEWLALGLSFVGWLLLSVATVGVLLVLFVIPYYLLTVTCYLGALSAEETPDSNPISD